MMPTVLRALMTSEKAVVSLAVLVCATVLAGLGKIPWGDWQDFAIWITGIYVGGKSIQGAANAFKGAAAPPKV